MHSLPSFRSASLRIIPVALLVPVALLIAAVDAHALPAPVAKCRDQIAKSQVRYVDTLFRTAAECHEARSTGAQSLSTECNDAVDGDVDGRNAKGAARFRAFVGGVKNRCAGADPALTAFAACPVPVSTADDGGATNGIDDFGEVADCLLALDNALTGPAMFASLGNPSSLPNGTAERCQRALGRAVGKLMSTYGKERRRCQKIVDKQSASLDYACHATDPRGKIGRAIVALNDAIVRDCSIGDADIQSLENCGTDTDTLRDCIEANISPIGSALVAFAYSLEGTGGGTTTTTIVTPTTTTTTTTLFGDPCGTTFPACGGSCTAGRICTNTGAACECEAITGACAPATIRGDFLSRLGSPPGQTKLSVGWSGSTHNVDIPGHSVDIIDVTSCDQDCENCDVSVNPIETDPFSPCRCVSDTSIRCDVINGPDTDDCGGVNSECLCFFGAPLAISSGGTPVCVVNEILEDYSGTMSLRTGDADFGTRLAALVYLGISQTSPCPTCQGDAIPNDGVEGGTCSGGVSSGSCDVNGTHATFGPMSYDCAPSPLLNISGGGLQLSLQFSTGTSTLEYNLPCDPPFGDCPCRVCSGNSSVGCASNADCAAVGAGDCTAGGGAGVQPNECSDGVCNSSGLCPAGPTDRFCDGITHGDGSGFITCTTNVDCSALSAGACTISQQRRCFPDPIVVTGSPDPINPIRAAAFCIPPTTSAAVNAAGGIPGPGTFELELINDVRCQSDPSILYDFPSGSSCEVTSTTTTTLAAGVPCESLAAPLCAAGNDCPPGEACVVDGSACGCQSTTTTTTLPPIPCAPLLPPLCPVGSDCPPGQGCVGSGSACGCQATTTTTLPPCGGATFPLCNGSCPGSQQCLAGALTCGCQ